VPGLGVELADPDVPGAPDEPDAPDDPGDLGVPGDSDRPDDGEPDGLADGDADGPGADPGEADADADGTDPDGTGALGWVGELGASCLQAAMITRSLAGSALPPTPLRSTK